MCANWLSGGHLLHAKLASPKGYHFRLQASPKTITSRICGHPGGSSSSYGGWQCSLGGGGGGGGGGSFGAGACGVSKIFIYTF